MNDQEKSQGESEIERSIEKDRAKAAINLVASALGLCASIGLLVGGEILDRSSDYGKGALIGASICLLNNIVDNGVELAFPRIISDGWILDVGAGSILFRYGSILVSTLGLGIKILTQTKDISGGVFAGILTATIVSSMFDSVVNNIVDGKKGSETELNYLDINL